jgi:hypothetical protein
MGRAADLFTASDPRKALSEELARLLATPSGLRLVRLLQATDLLAPQVSPEPSATLPAPPADTGPRPISLWQPREVGGELVFERPDPSPLGDHCAARKVIPARKGARVRICFFGESAAAGYLYAPHLTPALVLEAQLAHLAGPGAFEVVDLARTNETLRPLVATARAARQLSPDLLVIYAGNNWSLLETPSFSPYAPAVRARQRYAAALAREGVLGPAREARQELAQRAGRAFDEIAEIATIAGGRPVVLVLPEVNLADWESPQPVSWLPGEGMARWYAAGERARAHLAAGRAAAAEAAAWEMVELDGGTNPTPFRLLARALAAQGREEEARDACISEIDSQHYPLLAYLGAPQATTLAREILGHAARRHGFLTVDLRTLFAEHTGSPLPGRRLFLDYCHLTVEGMKVAMAAVAAQVLRATRSLPEIAGAPEGDWRDLLARLPDPVVSPEADATAKLGAALHTAHRLLTVEPERKLLLLEHWCQAALDASPGVAAALRDLAAARATGLPAILTAAFARNFSSSYRLLLQHGWRWDFLDADLLQVMRNVLVRAGNPAGEEIEALLLACLGLPAAGADLSRPPFLAEPLARFFPEAIAPDLTSRATYRSPAPESIFCLICDATCEVDLTLTARLPAVPGAVGAELRRGMVVVEVNGVSLTVVELAERWTRHPFVIGRDLLRAGLNRVTLRWPPPPPVGEAALAAAVRRLEEGIEADLHPVFGEVFALVARPAGNGAPPGGG